MEIIRHLPEANLTDKEELFGYSREQGIEWFFLFVLPRFSCVAYAFIFCNCPGCAVSGVR